MSLLRRFDPPAFMTDLDHVRDGRAQWDEFISLCFDTAIKTEAGRVPRQGDRQGTVQYFNAKHFDPGATLIEQPIVWNAFPKTLLRRFGRERALIEADSLWPLSPVNGFSGNFDSASPSAGGLLAQTRIWTRPLDEYCEWRVERDAATGRIRRITFTSEPPEYWTALFGGEIPLDDAGTIAYRFQGDATFATQLYRELTGAPVETDDLRSRGGAGVKVGDYNPYNKWNTTHGIAHLNCPPNSIFAEIQLGADGTVLRQRPDGTAVTNPDELICCAAYGGANRNSDPTIGATVNALARAGAMVTLANPVGLYMDNVDTSGWALPDGIVSADCLRIVRGEPGRIERLVLEVPPETGRTVSDLSIGGVPVIYGGQIAECITVKLVGAAAGVGTVKNARVPCVGQACLAPLDARRLVIGPAGGPPPAGMVAAFAETAAPLRPTPVRVAATSGWRRGPSRRTP
jgi:hypothetical protein